MKEFEYVSILTARLSRLPPEAAVETLRARNQKSQSEDPYLGKCPEAENALLARKEPLIDLGLAQYGRDDDVLKELYRRSLIGTEDAVLDMGVRLAALSNRLAPSRFFETNPVVDDDELRRLAAEGTEEEIHALLTNPMTRTYVARLFRRKPPFELLDDARFCALVNAAIRNPRLTYDDSTEHGPDSRNYDISMGIYELLSTVPVTKHWFWTFQELLSNYLPASTYGEKDVLQVIDRWRQLVFSKFNSEEFEEGFYTELKMTEEFCCQIAAMFGKYFEVGGYKIVGDVDSQDVVMRCAYYGNQAMKPKEMETARQKDGAVFTFAALHNSHFYWNRPCRAKLESMLTGHQIDMYSSICKKRAAIDKIFDASPVSDDLEVDDDVPQIDPLFQIRETIGQLQSRLAAIQKDASTGKAFGGWCLIILLVVLWKLS